VRSSRGSDRVAAGRLTFFGHATVMLELDGVRLLTDPVLRDRVLHLRRRSDPVDPAAIGDLDAVLLSHLHGDHLDTPSLRRLGRGTKIVAPSGSRGFLRRRGFTDVTELAAGGCTSIGGVDVAAVAVGHEGRRYPVGRSVQALGYDIRATSRVFFAGDTGPFDTDGLAGTDVALLPIAGWGPRVPAHDHLDPISAAEVAAGMRPRTVVPVHWGTFLRLGLERRAQDILERPPEEFAAQMAAVAPGVEVRVLSPGESMPLSSRRQRESRE
jgi:L-ascorbate metabolism protein UlaG (beta-lactamase superfamily)